MAKRTNGKAAKPSSNVLGQAQPKRTVDAEIQGPQKAYAALRD
ncbi:hypothetical protein OAK15_00920 [Verrucomicrobia bacterium]|nr:hypothetical protein [Verrucomicrobiota bacterium]